MEQTKVSSGDLTLKSKAREWLLRKGFEADTLRPLDEPFGRRGDGRLAMTAAVVDGRLDMCVFLRENCHVFDPVVG